MSNKPLTICISSYDWDDLAGRRPAELVQKLERDKLHPDKNKFLILSWGAGRYEREVAPNIVVVRRPARWRYLRPFYDVQAFFQAPRLIQRSGMSPDLMLVYDFPMVCALSRAARYCKAPLILGLTNLPRQYLRTRPQHLLTLPYLWFAEQMGKRLVDAVYTINAACRQYALNLGISTHRIVVFSSDTIVRERSLVEAAKHGALRARFAIPAKNRVLFSAARLESEKGLDRLIEAFSSLNRSDLTLVIAGKGSLRPELERLARTRGVAERVVFAGAVGRAEMWNFYKDADVFILLSRAEALGLVFWEAMYAGVPVVGSRAEGIAETISPSEERGYLWAPQDGIAALQERLDACLNKDATVLERMRRAREYVEQKLRDQTDIYTVYGLCKKN